MAAKCRLQNCPVMPLHLYFPVPLSATILENFDHSKGIVKLPAGEKISVEYDLGAMEFELQTAVEINPKKGEISFYPPGGAGCVYPMVCMTLILRAKSCCSRMKYRAQLRYGGL